VSYNTYAEVLQGIQGLIKQGHKVAAQEVAPPGTHIVEWLAQSEACLVLIEDKVPTAMVRFQKFRRTATFHVPVGEKESASKSAYRPAITDPKSGLKYKTPFLMDFRFESLQQVVGVLKLAAEKLTLEVSSGPPSELPIGMRLRAARIDAGHSLALAAEKLSAEKLSDEKMNCDAKTVWRWEHGAQPRPKARKRINAYIAKCQLK
jgi:hypothetical protein